MSDNSADLTVTDIPYGEVNRKSNGLRNLDKEKADIVTFDLVDLVDELCRITKVSIYGKFPKATFNEHCKNTVFRVPCGRNKIHPTQKPLELIERLILASSNEGDLVFDPII